MNAASIVQPAPELFGVPLDFVLFGITLLGVAVVHRGTMRIAVGGLLTISLYEIFFTGFKTGAGVTGFLFHVAHEWVILFNLLCLLLGFALLPRPSHGSSAGIGQVQILTTHFKYRKLPWERIVI